LFLEMLDFLEYCSWDEVTGYWLLVTGY
jgi:hypothetical protein